MRYDDLASGYDKLHGEEQLRKAEIVHSLINPKPSESLLDIGCGTGIALELFHCNRTGIDPSEKLLKMARKKMPDVNLIKAEAEDLPFANNRFDYVISITAIHNFQNVRRSISETKRVGKGTFVLTIMKRSDRFEEIRNFIHEMFVVKQEIDDGIDLILLCNA